MCKLFAFFLPFPFPPLMTYGEGKAEKLRAFGQMLGVVIQRELAYVLCG